MPNTRPLLAVAVVALVASRVAAQPTLDRTTCRRQITPQSGAASGGFNLTAADWDGNGKEELALGFAGFDEVSSGETNNGRLHIFQRADGEDESWSGVGLFAGTEGGRAASAVAAGDFDGDGWDEYAIGEPYSGGGMVTVLETPNGGCCQVLSVLVQGIDGVSGESEAGDLFGVALAAGDFDDDGFDDLAVGVPGESWSGASGEHQGAVHVFYGSATGVDGVRDALFGQDNFINQTREGDDQFGLSLAAGDLDGDGHADLAIGVPTENEGALVDSGVAHVVLGGGPGLDFTRQQTWSQSSPDVQGGPEDGDLFGLTLAIGNFYNTNDVTAPYADLAIGAPCEADGEILCAGVVHVLYSSPTGPTATGSEFFRRPGGSVAGARFGSALLAADLDGDAVSELAVAASGVTYAPPPGLLEATGEVHLYFSYQAFSLEPSGQAPLRATSGGACIDLAVRADRFGSDLAAGDFDNDGLTDLAIGISGWSKAESDTDQGAAQILYGSLFSDGFESGTPYRWSSFSL